MPAMCIMNNYISNFRNINGTVFGDSKWNSTTCHYGGKFEEKIGIMTFNDKESAKDYAMKICKDLTYFHISVTIRDPNSLDLIYGCYSIQGNFIEL
jgi:hypothetical protein